MFLWRSGFSVENVWSYRLSKSANTGTRALWSSNKAWQLYSIFELTILKREKVRWCEKAQTSTTCVQFHGTLVRFQAIAKIQNTVIAHFEIRMYCHFIFAFMLFLNLFLLFVAMSTLQIRRHYFFSI